jgi:hypothetical protein
VSSEQLDAQPPSGFLRTLITGILIGSIPSLSVAIYQSNKQLHQAIVTERISAVKAFAETINVQGYKLLSKVDAAILSLNRISPQGEITTEEYDKIRKQHDEYAADFQAWIAQVNVSYEMCHALFGPKRLPRDIEMGSSFSQQNSMKKEGRTRSKRTSLSASKVSKNHS